MKKKLVAIIVSLLVVGGSGMAYLNEVSGKIRTKQLQIGDGVDKIHTPLQVAPSMATDMLNLSGVHFPTLSTRNGRKESIKTSFVMENSTDTYLGSVKPFMASNGDLHYLYVIKNNPPASYPTLTIYWYVLRNGNYTPDLVHTANIITDALFNAANDLFTVGNFTEYAGKVYMEYLLYTAPATPSAYVIITYNNNTREVLRYDDALLDIEVSNRVCPSAIYQDRLFFAANERIYYSYPFVPTDFTSPNTGNIPRAQGGNVTVLMPMRDRMLISTDTSLFILMGTGFDSFSVHLLTDNLGIRNPKRVTQKNGIVYFIGTDGDVYEYNGNTLINLSREPIDTGSRSGVRGGFENNSLNLSSISIENNSLYCLDSTPSVGGVYVFDIVKRRWFIESLPYPDVNVSTFNNAGNAYYLRDDVVTSATPDRIDTYLLSVNNGLTKDSSWQINVAGTKQKETNTVIGTVAAGAGLYCRVTITHPLFYATPIIYDVTVAGGDINTAIASKIVTWLNSKRSFNEYFIATVASASVIVESKIAYANESTFNIEVKNGNGTGITTTNSANTTAGIANTYQEVESSTPIPFNWVSSAIQINPTGIQALKALHFSYYSPMGSDIGVYVSNTIDGDDFQKIGSLTTSALKQNKKLSLGFTKSLMNEWIRVKLEGYGPIEVYGMNLDWRVLDRIR
jgi:hypothetical protein